RCINTYDFIEQSALDLKEYLDF
ncbi:CAAX protease, partial [Acinetobacter baumannii]